MITLCACLWLLAPVGGWSQTLTLATGEWAPYVSRDLPKNGFITEIISEALRIMDVEPRYVFYPWRRCYEGVVSGKVWAAFPYSRTEEREKEVLYSDNISYSVTKFFTYGDADIDGYASLEALKPYRIGGIIGYFYESAFKRGGLTVDYAPGERSALEKLMLGRTDLLPLNELVGWYLIKASFPEKMDRFNTLEPPYSVDDLHLIVSKSYPDAEALLNRFNQALKTVKDNYIYEGILDRYKVK